MNEGEKQSIQPMKNGPYMVRHVKRLTNSNGEDLNSKPLMLLCRCGGSNKKPYCDGTHIKIGFIGDKAPDRVPNNLDSYEGSDLTIHDNRGVCAHRGCCTDNAPNVFNPEKEPWINPDGQSAEETTNIIQKCPSGALSYTKDGVLSKEWHEEKKIIITKDGPYDVQGTIALEDLDGNTPETKDHYTLCRCGHSKNKPFCDGQHSQVDFRDPKPS
jgi:CDGSH-type Zn-finger protein